MSFIHRISINYHCNRNRIYVQEAAKIFLWWQASFSKLNKRTNKRHSYTDTGQTHTSKSSEENQAFKLTYSKLYICFVCVDVMNFYYFPILDKHLNWCVSMELCWIVYNVYCTIQNYIVYSIYIYICSVVYEMGYGATLINKFRETDDDLRNDLVWDE